MKKIICEYLAREEIVAAMKNVNSLEEYYEVAEQSDCDKEEAFAAFILAKDKEWELGERLMEMFMDNGDYIDFICDYTEG
jgi:hypothetical protein